MRKVKKAREFYIAVSNEFFGLPFYVSKHYVSLYEQLNLEEKLHKFEIIKVKEILLKKRGK